VFVLLKKSGSAIYRYKINSNVEMLKGEVNINVCNSSEDDVYKFIVGWLIEGGNLWKVWRLVGRFCFDILVDL
jgi:hypothetical protein